MKNAVIFFKGEEVCRLLFDEVISLDNEHSFNIDNREVASFNKGEYSYAVTNAVLPIGVTVTMEDIVKNKEL
jgi:hypothetical protein